MQEYTKSILHLPCFKITREPRVEERETAQGIVVREVFHGVLTNEMPGHCKHCGGKLHANQYLIILLHHLTIGNRMILKETMGIFLYRNHTCF